MAILHQKKNGGYYIGYKLGWKESPRRCTVEEKGVAFLRTQLEHLPTYHDTNGLPISDKLFETLKERQWLIFGTNVGDEVVKGSAPKLLNLACLETSGGWELKVVCPKIPNEWVQAEYLLRTKTHSLYIKDHRMQHSITHVVNYLASKNKPLCTIRPQEEDYQVEVVDWPRDWNAKERFGNKITGLSTRGTLFHGPDKQGIRLQPQDLVYPDRDYYFVAPANTSLPSELHVEDLGTIHIQNKVTNLRSWQAWKINFQENENGDPPQRIRDWLEELNYTLREVPWKLTLVSPPALHYTPHHVPIIEQHKEIILAAHHSINSQHSEEEIELKIATPQGHILNQGRYILQENSYIVLSLPQPGNYLIKATEARIQPLEIKISSTNPRLMEIVDPLTVIFETENHAYKYIAFDKQNTQRDYYDEQLEPSDLEGDLKFTIQCPVPLDITWRIEDKAIQRKRQISAKDAAKKLSEEIEWILEDGGLFNVRLDAGSFGLIKLQIEAPSSVQLSHKTMLTRKMRWLSEVISSENSLDTQYVPMPPLLKDYLSQCDTSIERDKLISLTRIPTGFLGHMIMLTRLTK
ncbi:hypothetical protein KDW_39280 [Dictyobacter vulcani]|uniref:Uncharacterized protein n=1 Tax=Dictyobacter vulcani TaxID=2607529 RepID=A0A5J4KX37_9CHLR|nr:hypothetical protein [Dictyobacter vulcani]GER89766.1 hypothetical protein KDW_39280 [Dictyobacter vulcani]